MKLTAELNKTLCFKMHCRYAFCTGTVLLFNFILQVGAHIIIASTLYIKLYNMHLLKYLFSYSIDICLIFDQCHI